MCMILHYAIHVHSQIFTNFVPFYYLPHNFKGPQMQIKFLMEKRHLEREKEREREYEKNGRDKLNKALAELMVKSNVFLDRRVFMVL